MRRKTSFPFAFLSTFRNFAQQINEFMRFAFIISAHNDPVHLKRMIESLPQQSVFMVHIDAKSDIQPFTSIISDPRVCFVKNRTDVMWGSIGVVEAQMTMIRKALELHRQMPINYFISLSGLDYPLWSNERIESYFAEQKGREFIVTLCMEGQGEAAQLYREHRPFNYKSWKYGSLGSKFRVALRHIIYALGIRKSLRFKDEGREYVLHKGSMWWAISPELAQLALSYWNEHPQYVHYFHDGFAPDETFIPTLTAHSDFATKAIQMKGKFKNLESITPLTFIDYTNGIKVFTEEDFDMLINSDKIFCRKTITGKSNRLMDMIDDYRNSSPLPAAQ